MLTSNAVRHFVSPFICFVVLTEDAACLVSLFRLLYLSVHLPRFLLWLNGWPTNGGRVQIGVVIWHWIYGRTVADRAKLCIGGCLEFCSPVQRSGDLTPTIYGLFRSVIWKILHLSAWILPFNEAIASWVAFVIVSGVDGWRRFWSRLNNSKTVRDRVDHMCHCQWGTNREPWVGYAMGLSPILTSP